MQIDANTVVLCGILIRTLLAILFLSFWIKDRQATRFGWWSAGFFLGDLMALFYLRSGFAVASAPSGFVVAALIAGAACCWQGARAFEGRAPCGSWYWGRRHSGCSLASSPASLRT